MIDEPAAPTTSNRQGARPPAISPSLEDFAALYEHGKPQVVSTRLIADLETPVSTYLKLGNAPMSFLLESIEGGSARGRYSVIGFAPDVVWKAFGETAEINRSAANNPDAFERDERPVLQSLRDLIAESAIELPETLPPMAAGIFGYMGYDTVRLIEKLPEMTPDSLGVPDAILMRPTQMLIFDNVKDEMILVTPVRPQPDFDAEAAYAAAQERIQSTIARLEAPLAHTSSSAPHHEVLDELQSNTSAGDYKAMVARAQEYIKAGDIFQVVLSQRFSTRFTLPSFALYRSLRRLNPSPFLFHLDFGELQLVGSSPEILVRARDGVVTIRPIAGTTGRGATDAEDKALASRLLADPKERSEHLMLLDLGRNDVGRVSVPGSVSVTDKFIIERYSHVMHIVSNVIGRLDEDNHDAIDALMAGFPAGTVSGAPKVRAMEIIAELEKSKRGPYAGCVGYFSASGEMDTCIILRTAVLKDGMIHIQAGAGVVHDSIPENEQQECINKAMGVVRAAEDAVRFASKSSNASSTSR
jgi:anthranilate synthase component I